MVWPRDLRNSSGPGRAAAVPQTEGSVCAGCPAVSAAPTRWPRRRSLPESWTVCTKIGPKPHPEPRDVLKTCPDAALAHPAPGLVLAPPRPGLCPLPPAPHKGRCQIAGILSTEPATPALPGLFLAPCLVGRARARFPEGPLLSRSPYVWSPHPHHTWQEARPWAGKSFGGSN